MKERCVPLAVDAMFAWKQDDAEGRFLQENRCMVATSSGAAYLITAEGQTLGRGLGMRSLDKGLAAWDALPEEDRRPGAITIGERGPRDPKAVALAPPEGALILRVASRHLVRDGNGELRYLEADDFPDEYHRRSFARKREPANDFMWVLGEEWEALTPVNPRVGDRIPVPESFTLRMFRYHCNPLLGLMGGMWFTRSSSDVGGLTAVVEEVSDHVRLRLEGAARLTEHRNDAEHTYEPAFLGYVEYGRADRTIDRFEMVALGDLEGEPRGFSRGIRPFGVAYELIVNPGPAEKLRPHAAGKSVNRYLNP